MSHNKKEKFLTIDIQYKDREELKSTLERIGNLVSLGVDQFKESGDNSTFDYETKYLISDEIDYRYEQINGKTYLILPSKMNKK
tara:strand:+ start:899 stop:1150 length:252 start_codon:yes stop_codon:yes gene_type:complete